MTLPRKPIATSPCRPAAARPAVATGGRVPGLAAFTTTALLALVLLALAPAALAQGAPQWSITATSGPASFAPGDGADEYTLTAINTGAAATDGTPVTLADVLPAGLTVTNIVGGDLFVAGLTFELFGFGQVSCEQATVSCRFEGTFDPGDELIVTVTVAVDSSLAGSVTATASVSGGGAPAAQASSSTPIGTAPTPFGFAPGSVLAATSTSQAGAHPNLTVAFTLTRSSPSRPAREMRDVQVELPPGLVGSATATPRCSLGDLHAAKCPSDTMVGIATVAAKAVTNLFWQADPVYNVTPYAGEPAAFAFAVAGVPARLDTSVRSGSDYGITTTASQVSTAEAVISTTVTLWGVPAEHNGAGRDTGVLFNTNGIESVSFGGSGSSAGSAALLTNPTDCAGGPLGLRVHMDSWPQGTAVPSQSASASTMLPAVTGCDALQFEPSLRLRPDTTVADSPAGVDAEIVLPQDENPDGLATPELRDATVTLPVGASLSPTIADGLQGCTAAQIALHSTAPATCPAASQVGTATIETPALPDPLRGQIFVGTPECSQCTNADAQSGAMVHGYIQAQGDGVIVKLPGSFALDPGTGQITARFLENPQQPFSDLKLHFKGGPRGALATPEACGVYSTTSAFAPWSAPDSGPNATPFDSFAIDSGCVSGFAPSFTAGSGNPQAGRYSPFGLSLARADTDQNLAGLSVSLPPGLLAKVAGVPLCPDANANAGSCPDASQVGTVQVGAGPGPNPFFVSGKAYLTGPYKGGPYGLAVEVPAVAGPFNLGTVVVRQSLRIDPHDAHVTAVSDPFPTILDGVPLRVRRVDVTLDRPGFMFNPTSCQPTAIAGVLTSTAGASANVSSRFQVGGCGELPFHPSFTVATQARTSKASGASLDVKVGSSAGQANIGKVAVTLPKQLPSRLTTIQQACPEATFAANPAACPAGSDIGTVTALTPVLASPLTGPAYLVSHGGAAFPDLVVILQGEGVTLDLVGSIDIKHGVTSSAFDTVPDAPISSFELTLPEGPHSALATNLPAKARGNLCGTRLTMPTTITGQNGAQVKQSTRIAVSGCPKAKKAKKKKKPKHRHRQPRKK